MVMLVMVMLVMKMTFGHIIIVMISERQIALSHIGQHTQNTLQLMMTNMFTFGGLSCYIQFSAERIGLLKNKFFGIYLSSQFIMLLVLFLTFDSFF